MSDSPTTPSLDCTIYVRRYLIKRRSNLGGIALSSGGGKFVSIPDDAIETSHGVVGLRRRPGGLERDVGFVFMKDLHKHSSVMYKNQGISTEPFRVHAHGVALVEANRSGFKYRRGDKFWLFDKHASTVEDGGNLAPVVNLRTGEYGSVVITDVCWYPDVEGDNGDLWTVIGGFREIRGGRAGTSIRTIYRVSHRVDATVQVFGQVKIDKDLMPKERRKMLYLEIRKALGDVIEPEDLSCLAQCITPSVPLSPPPTPPLMATAPLPTASWRTSQSLGRVKTEAKQCPNVVEPASMDDGIGRRLNRSTILGASTEGLAQSLESVIPRNRVPPRRKRRTQRKVKIASPRFSPATELDSSTTAFSSGASASSFTSTRASSIQESDRQSSPEVDLEEDYGGVRVLESPEPLDVNRRYPQKGCRPYSTYFKESFCRTDVIQVSPKWGPNVFRAKRAFNKRKDGQIDVKVGEIITNVAYSPIIDIDKEYFWRGRNSRGFIGEFPSWVCGYDTRDSLPFKTILYDLAKLFPGRCRESRPHRHCVSSLHAAPGVRGRCVLGGRPRTGRPHICCTWSRKDWKRANVLALAESGFDDRKLKDSLALQLRHACVMDKSSLAEERLVRHPPGEAEYVMEIIISSES